ncbi:hypothetical protein ambt_18025 [Alteromonas naphthalenivorans]|uniref:Uncharacterized protein n=1 Tax=Alteromonas naphthalenivorans TaxID=715451 RepID=F5ZFG9_ALTNA|nr:hypothetical protein ambt_18025 [Alteromonas naphthalenivorans]
MKESDPLFSIVTVLSYKILTIVDYSCSGKDRADELLLRKELAFANRKLKRYWQPTKPFVDGFKNHDCSDLVGLRSCKAYLEYFDHVLNVFEIADIRWLR